jgi:3-phenylpropionate/trans-cinnamate dioxygenase ferredoxin subunit
VPTGRARAGDGGGGRGRRRGHRHRNSGGEIYAIADECSHAAIPLSEGDVGDGEIECYMHGSRFSLKTGEPLGLPATEPVAVYPVQVTDGDIYVDVSHSRNGI